MLPLEFGGDAVDGVELSGRRPPSPKLVRISRDHAADVYLSFAPSAR